MPKKLSKLVPIVPGKSGNTKQISPSKHWFFTCNNYTNNEIDIICSNSSIKRYVFQEETGENGTPHLQGYINFNKKVRPKSVFSSTKFHWEKVIDIKGAVQYCQKEETRTGKTYTKGIMLIEPIKCLKYEQLYQWQSHIVDLCNGPVDDRAINWYYEYKGNVGKSALVRYLVLKHNAILVSGKSADIKYQVKQFVDKHMTGPKIILYDIPRTAKDYVNYTALEEIKNGVFASNKYESSMVVINPPHFICFSNFEPNYDAVSLDRWRITCLEEEGSP